MRFFTPIVLLAAALFLRIYNPSESGDVLLFPFISTLVPSTAGDPMAQARASELILWAAGALSLALSLWRWRREQSDD